MIRDGYNMPVSGFSDERELVLLSIITGIFILVTLDQTIGVVFAMMSFAYAVILNQSSSNVFQFSRSSFTTQKFGLALLAFGGFVGITAIVLGGQEQFVGAVTFFASSFLTNFVIDNPFIKLFVFGVFVPIAESLFFFGVILPYILRKAKAKGNLQDSGTLLAVAMTAGVATAFHFTVRLLNDQALIADLMFFGISGMIAVNQKELSGLTLLHVVANIIFVGPLVGLLPRLI